MSKYRCREGRRKLSTRHSYLPLYVYDPHVPPPRHDFPFARTVPLYFGRRAFDPEILGRKIKYTAAIKLDAQ